MDNQIRVLKLGLVIGMHAPILCIIVILALLLALVGACMHIAFTMEISNLKQPLSGSRMLRIIMMQQFREMILLSNVGYLQLTSNDTVQELSAQLCPANDRKIEPLISLSST